MSNGQRTLKVLQLIGGYVVVKKAVKVANFLNSPPKQKTRIQYDPAAKPKPAPRAFTPEEKADIKASMRAGVEFIKAITDDGPTDVTLKFNGKRLVVNVKEPEFDDTDTGTRQALEQDGVDDTGIYVPPETVDDFLNPKPPDNPGKFDIPDHILRGDPS